jgi:two-component system, NtrC family, sensor kinase
MVGRPRREEPVIMESADTYILCVDDDADFLEFYREVLGAGGYNVSCCTNQKEALQRMEEAVPSLVVTDLMMESMSEGFIFSREIKENKRFRRVPIILITAIGVQRGFNFSPKGEVDLKAMNADAYFDKPVAPDILLSKVKELLNR